MILTLYASDKKSKGLYIYIYIIHLSLVLLTKSLRTMQLRKGIGR